MVDIDKLVRENVIKLTPYSCARDDFSGKSGTFLDANENPYGNLNRYPDPYQKDLKAAIAGIKNISKEKIFIGNGSDEVIDLCFRVFCNPGTDKALTFSPTYGIYEVSASVNDIQFIKVPLNEMFQIDLKKVTQLFEDKNLKLIFICSPNNPTGNCMNLSDIESIISRFKGIVVIDEAYIDFSDKPSFTRLIDKYPNLIVMQTFSKALGLAAVRVGVAFSNKKIIQYFNKVKPPYNISAINQQTALRMLNKYGENKDQIYRIIRERDRLSLNLKKIKITEKVFPTDSNFILVKVRDANSVYKFLAANNIIVRNRSNIIGNCLRITVGKWSENNQLINVLKSFPE